MLGGLCTIFSVFGALAALFEQSSHSHSAQGGVDYPVRQVYARDRASTTSPGSMPATLYVPPIATRNTNTGLRVGLISGAPGHRVATINGEPFSEGESHKLTFGQRKLNVQCVEIREQLVVAKVEGNSTFTVLRVGQVVPLANP